MSCGCEEQCTCLIQGDGVTTFVGGDGSPGDPYVVQALAGNELRPGDMWPTASFAALPANHQYADGATISRATYADAFDAITFQQGGDVVTGQPEVINLADTSDMWVGMEIESADFPAGTTILSVDSVSQITASANATATTTTTVRFLPWGAGDGATTFNKPDPNRRALIGAAPDYEAGSSDGLAEGARDRDHTHGVGTLATSNAGSHAHSVNITTTSNGAHTHGPGSLSTGTPSTIHTGVLASVDPAEVTCLEAAAAANGCPGSVLAAVTAATATHDHDVDSGVTGSNGAHTHQTLGATANEGPHSHPVTGVTGGGSSPWLAVKWVIKLA